MRVMRLIARLNVGGPARHVVWLHEALAADAFAEEFTPLLVTGTVPPGEVDMRTFAAAHGVTPTIVPSMSREMSPRDLFAVWDVWRLMVRARPDLVHTHTAKAGAVGRLAGLLYRFVTPSILWLRPRRCKFVHTYHGHIFRHYYGAAKTRLVLFVERLLARLNTDRIIVLGEQQLREIRDTFAVGRPEQYVTVPLGIEVHDIVASSGKGAALRAAWGIGATQTVVGIVGRLAAIKNHDLFLRVAARASNGTRFVVYGDGGERDRLVSRTAELQIEDRIVFAGTCEADEIYASLDVAALTSRNEGTPLAIIEAMAAGKPVVSTSVGGVVDLLGAVEQRIETGGSYFEIRERGLTAPSDDAAAFSGALEHLLHDESLQRRLVERGRAYVNRTHTRQRLIDDIVGVYRGLNVGVARGSDSARRRTLPQRAK
jgi:glycosyltransferase involved in cell wall biosynthesis